MKAMIIGLIILVGTFLLLADTTITFSPFTFKMASLGKAIGWMFLIIGVMIMEIAAERRGEANGRAQVINQLEEAVKEAKIEASQDSIQTVNDQAK